jgi:hypothetical protein
LKTKLEELLVKKSNPCEDIAEVVAKWDWNTGYENARRT